MTLTFSNGKTIYCADCKIELGPHAISQDPIQAYNEGIALGKKLMDHARRHHDQDSEKERET